MLLQNIEYNGLGIMERVKKICKHPLYILNQSRLDEMERDRKFCCHSVNHSLDVARIMYIMVLEQELSYDKELVYAAALLHDLGRGMQHEKKVSHHQLGAELAWEILNECDFDEEEIALITGAIASHKNGEIEHLEGVSNKEAFATLFYRADKMSRNCYDCKAQEECYWEMEKRNLYIKY